MYRQEPSNVHGEHPVDQFARQLCRGKPRSRRRVVDEHVHVAEPLERSAGQAARRAVFAEVAGRARQGRCAAQRRAPSSACSSRAISPDAAPARSSARAVCGADPAAGPRDQRGAALEHGRRASSRAPLGERRHDRLVDARAVRRLGDPHVRAARSRRRWIVGSRSSALATSQNVPTAPAAPRSSRESPTAMHVARARSRARACARATARAFDAAARHAGGRRAPAASPVERRAIAGAPAVVDQAQVPWPCSAEQRVGLAGVDEPAEEVRDLAVDVPRRRGTRAARVALEQQRGRAGVARSGRGSSRLGRACRSPVSHSTRPSSTSAGAGSKM